MILYLKNINDCYEKKDKIVEEISKVISDSAKKVDTGSKPHWSDKAGNSKVSQVYFDFPNKDKIGIECYDWSDKLEEKYSDDDDTLIFDSVFEITEPLVSIIATSYIFVLSILNKVPSIWLLYIVSVLLNNKSTGATKLLPK